MKKVLITGGTGGIGTAITKEFLSAGYHAIVTHNYKSGDKIESWLNENQLSSSQVTFLACDLTDASAAQQIFGELVQNHQIDVLVNNAGITDDSAFLKMQFEQWKSVLETNLFSLFHITQTLARQMVQNGGGNIINISSINGLKGQFGQTNYAASKAGIIGFTKSLAQELARKNVRVNAIAPGYTNTPMVAKLNDNILQAIKSNIPTQQLADPAEIARTALFLVSDISSLTGETISVNGGQYMH